MFFGKIITPSESYTIDPQEYSSQVLSITNCMLDPASQGSVSLYLKNQANQEQTLLLKLTKLEPHANLNLYFAVNEEIVTFMVRGKGKLHLTGFYQNQQIEEEEQRSQLMKKYQQEQYHQNQQEKPSIQNQQQQEQQQAEQQQEEQQQEPQVNSSSKPSQSEPQDYEIGNQEDEQGIDDDINVRANMNGGENKMNVKNNKRRN